QLRGVGYGRGHRHLRLRRWRRVLHHDRRQLQRPEPAVLGPRGDRLDHRGLGPGPNCAGAAPHESAGYNLDTGVSCAFAKPTDLTAADPRLGPLAANGGPTLTR